MKTFRAILLAALILALSMGGALAQTVRFTGNLPTIDLMNVDGEKKGQVTPEKLVLLGAAGEQWVQVYADGEMGYVPTSALTAISPELGKIALPELSELEDIARGSDHEVVAKLQQALIDLGYLEGGADGVFGNMTTRAISAFQEAMGLNETGVANAVTQQLVFSLAGEEKVISLYSDPAEQFAAISSRSKTDLTPLYGKALILEYDDITGKGFISNGNSAVIVSEEGQDIDQYEFDLTFGFRINETNGEVTVNPVLMVKNTSVRRPMVNKIYLKSLDDRISRTVSNKENGVSGSKSTESCILQINAACAEVLSKVAENGELRVRLEGKYQNYDLTVPQDQLEKIAEIGRIAAEMLAE